ncbi:uncharacterized protein LOC109852349 isoform X2 [Pseudomyrmex gracilis]|uniref:uncharacterized protein LOC109852349 isoform X2 n=1 Tax=Pseudomyrmex gracilis TaxID=219809 RepID=UPI0009953C6A|nr:uncharacterized protein LOC109852349 isoform X2 [Pseudomyrmex gracilis]
MQWRRQKKVTHVIGSSNHVLLLARYQDAPPGEEDEEDGLRKDYVKNSDKDAHTFDRNGQQGSYKSYRGGTSTSGDSTSSYANSGSRSHRDDSAGSPSRPKIIFNEDEYTRITTPRQDVLFKKGYLSRKKPWTGNASTSATPSTTESQSASHSTADGSETTEDQQLLDRDSGMGEYPPMVEPGTQLGYGAFYDHTSGYFYEYPVMLVGPAPVPPPVGPSVLATVPCDPVPLRPIEWINPAYVPKLANQPYCVMDYQTSQNTEPATIGDGQNGTLAAAATAEVSNNMWNESGTGSASCSGSIAGETEEQTEEADSAAKEQPTIKEQFAEEQHLEEQHLERQHLENGHMMPVDPYLDPLMMQEPMHIPHVMPAVPQPYMYPGHYMFGPPLVNVNGVTIQGGPLVRTMDVTAMTMACGKRRKKKKKKKQRRLISGNTEDEEEGEYSSECDNDVSSSRLPWSECSTSTAITTTATKRPLNPECQEFQLRPALQSKILSSPDSTSVVPTMIEEITSSVNDVTDVSSCVNTDHKSEKICDTSNVQSPTNQTATCNLKHVTETSLENVQSVTFRHKPKDKNTEVNGQANHLVEDSTLTNQIEKMRNNAIDHETLKTDITENNDNSIGNNVKRKLLESNSNNVNTILLDNCVKCPGEALTNKETNSVEHVTDLTDKASKSLSTTSQNNSSDNDNSTVTNVTESEKEVERLRNCNNSTVVRTTSLQQQQQSKESKKYNKKGSKFVREPTPGPDLNDTTTHLDIENGKLVQQFEAVQLSENTGAIADYKRDIANDKLNETDQEVANEDVFYVRNNEGKIRTSQDNTTEGSNEDSGFESQTRLSKYPIMSAVTEWLRQANSDDLFITSASTSESETDEDGEEIDAKPPKNLQGNPMPALSANSGVDNFTVSRTASCGEFAKANNNSTTVNQTEVDSISSRSIGRRKRDTKGAKRKTKRIDKRNKNVDEKTQSQLVSSLVSSNRLENLVTAVRLKDTLKNNVGNVCEFTQEDSVAGMRVALSSRINSKKANAKRMKTLRKINGNTIENIDIKMRRIDDSSGKEMNEDCTVSVRTFEKGEIIVSEDGRLLPTSSYEPISSNDQDNLNAAKTATDIDIINENVDVRKESGNNNEKDENNSIMIASSVSIEEPDVLECWEAETIEPVITPRRILQSPGILCEGEAAEEDNFEIEKATIEHVQKYYRLARDTISVEEELGDVSTSVISSRSRTVPNNSEKLVEHFCSEEIPIIIPDKFQDKVSENEKIPIDEAFEVYESCYNGKSPFFPFNPNPIKQQPLYGQNGETPIPCRAVCCNIQ